MLPMKFEYFSRYDDLPIFIQYGEHTEDLYEHYHEHYSELVLVLNGSAVHVIDGFEQYIEKGDIFVLNENINHGYKNPENFKIVNLMFKPQLIFKNQLDIEKTVGFQALFVIEPKMLENKTFEAFFKPSFTDFQKITEYLEEMTTEYNEKKEGWKTLLISDFIRLVVILSRLYTLSNGKHNSSSYYLANVISHIEMNFSQPLKVSELAEMANLSQRHFLRIFKETYGQTPSDYINLLRLERSKTLLKTTSLPITAIAVQCGFNSSNYFTRLFSKTFGINPIGYRKK